MFLVRWFNKGTAVLGIVLLFSSGVASGIWYSKRPTSSTASNGTLSFGSAGATNFGGNFGGGNRRSRNGGSGVSANFGGFGGGGSSTQGTITKIQGNTIYLRGADGQAITVKADSTTPVIAATTSKLNELKVGDAVTVSGQVGNDGSITPTAVSKGDLPAGLRFGGGNFGGGNFGGGNFGGGNFGGGNGALTNNSTGQQTNSNGGAQNRRNRQNSKNSNGNNANGNNANGNNANGNNANGNNANGGAPATGRPSVSGNGGGGNGGSGNGGAFLWSWVREARTRGFIVIAPTALGSTWALMDPETDGANIDQIVDRVAADWNLDSGRRLLTGMSDGGTFTYALGLRGGCSFTHLAPIAASFHPLLMAMADADRLRGLPVNIVHGTQDWMFPPEMAQMAHRSLAQAGANVTYREVADLSHTYPRDENGRILDWFMFNS